MKPEPLRECDSCHRRGRTLERDTVIGECDFCGAVTVRVFEKHPQCPKPKAFKLCTRCTATLITHRRRILQ